MSVSGIGGNAAAQAATSLDGKKSSGGDAVQEFLDYMKKSPAERMQDAWLRQHHMTREQLAAMSPEERRKIEEQMREDIARQIKQNMESKFYEKGNGLL